MSKILELAEAIDKEFEEQKQYIDVLQAHAAYLEQELNKEKHKRRITAEKLREFALWLESEE